MQMPTVASDDRNWAIYANAAGLLVFTNIPFANVLATLVIWLKVRNDPAKPFARLHAASALNFQLTWELVTFAYVALVIAAVVRGAHDPAFGARFDVVFPGTAWFVALFVAWFVLNIVFCIVGCAKASDVKPYRYPFAIPFVR